MANLSAVSNIDTESDYATGAIALMLENSPILRDFDSKGAFEIDTTDFDFSPIENSSNFAPRPIGGGFNRQFVNPSVAKIPKTQKIYGDDVAVDETYKRDEALGIRDINSIMRGKLRSRFIDWVIKFDNELMNGAGAGDAMKGLSKILDGTNLPGHSVNRLVDMASFLVSGDSFDLTDVDNHTLFLEKMDNLLRKVPNATSIYAHPDFITKLTTIAYERRGIIGTMQNYGNLVDTFRNIPLIPMNEDVITKTEDDNASTPNQDTTSFYILRPSEGQLSIVTNSGLAWKDYDPTSAGDNAKGYVWEFGLEYKVEKKDSILRVRNIKL